MGLSLGSILGGIGAIAGGPLGAGLASIGGLLEGSNAASGQRRRMSNADRLQAEALQLERDRYNRLLPLFDQQLAGFKRMNRLGDVIAGLAEGYNPRRETDQSVGYASKVAQNALETGLRNLNAGIRSEGGIPGRSTEYRVNSNAIANNALGPLQEFAANRAANESTRKIQMLQAAAGAPLGQVGDILGSLTSQLGNASRREMALGSQPLPDSSGAFSLLGEVLNGILKPRSGGANRQSPRSGGSPSLMEFLQLFGSGTPGINNAQGWM